VGQIISLCSKVNANSMPLQVDFILPNINTIYSQLHVHAEPKQCAYCGKLKRKMHVLPKSLQWGLKVSSDPLWKLQNHNFMP
jgi:hypothetical protein